LIIARWGADPQAAGVVMDIILGFRAHSGWAMAAAVAVTGGTPSVLDRRRIEITGAGLPRQPYHEVEEWPLHSAEPYLARCMKESNRLAGERIGELCRYVAAHGKVLGGALLVGSGRSAITVAEALSSHPRLHTAEGEMYRAAIRAGCAEHGITVSDVPEKTLWETATRRLRLTEEQLRDRLAAIGRALGPPWTQDEKFASLAAWSAADGLTSSEGNATRPTG